ncbi:MULTISPECIES: exopolysaccharide transport family protein [unclassified Leeuwenhoekiella]|uniref:exopolysaccharide transport family protein n=1 Tax=unclassified Leeuwenhoekiella TaxID=2615029 RepID=UPI000C3EA789|nr:MULTISPECIES: polysaccharide biosynthesis tyrosine autokinase [unclassified Leeuwenhoekiella]MBA81537.1 sugar transporter [Leeuwenhoekiella sp.]|tara:strand:+ start:12405 stop:14891 length:2487 start_codon:yes stop_codon:yes gene_type:complete
MEDEFEIKDLQNFFDFRGFLLKVLSWWPLFVLCIGIGYYIAYYKNVRRQTVYRMSNMITVKDDQNPFFTSNTSLTFNWGGTTDKVQTAIILLRSRSHNEDVVEKLQFYVDYLQQGEYHLEDIYGSTPFKVDVNTARPQLLGRMIKVVFDTDSTYTLNIDFNGGSGSAQNYDTKETFNLPLPAAAVNERYALGDPVDLPYFNFKLNPSGIPAQIGKEYLIRFNGFNGVVGRYRGIGIDQTPSGSSILSLSLKGTNKSRLVDYLNSSVRILAENQLERKNLFATKTIQFIDSSLAIKSVEMKNVQEELDKFRDENSSIGIGSSEESLIAKITELDAQKQNLEQRLQYYRDLENYLRSREDYGTDIPAPSITGIGEGSVTSSVSSIIELAEERRRLAYTAKPNNPAFKDLDRRINAIKAVLFENMASSQQILNNQLRDVRNEIARTEGQMRKLPAEQQQLFGIQRRYNLTEGAYGVFLDKRSQAGIVKAANVSDIIIIDEAKDTGGGAISANDGVSYVMAVVGGTVVPLTFVFLLFFFDTKISNPNEIKRLSGIPVLGAIGKSVSKSNLVVIEDPRSAVAEAFRGLRSSLQFIYRKQNIQGAKTVRITSSVSGEGKTFCSINLASVFALSERKTVLVGLDLRKPKIFGDFDLPNEHGVVNYLIGESKLDEVIQKTKIPHLDVILAGAVPPNPSELLMSDQMKVFMAELKKRYDYIILDTPPVGLVSDALELDEYIDATLYVIRQHYTKKGMLRLINDKYQKKEIQNISFVLNYFSARSKLGYGYGYGYEYGYGYGKYGEAYRQSQSKKGIVGKGKKLYKKAGRWLDRQLEK